MNSSSFALFAILGKRRKNQLLDVRLDCTNICLSLGSLILGVLYRLDKGVYLLAEDCTSLKLLVFRTKV